MGGLFSGKVALVTGGATGIGRAAVLRFAEEGASVGVFDINEKEGAETIRLVEQEGGKAHFIKGDITKPDDIKAMVEETAATYGRLDAAFNNAAMPGDYKNVVDCTAEGWDHVSGFNLRSVMLSMKYEIPEMLKNGGGAIVNNASAAANHPFPNSAAYVSTKSGVVGLSGSAALDFAAQKIRVNTILPGPTLTPMLVAGFEGINFDIESFGQMLPMKRIAEPREQANAVIWLCSDQSSFITGMAISVDGGLHLL